MHGITLGRVPDDSWCHERTGDQLRAPGERGSSEARRASRVVAPFAGQQTTEPFTLSDMAFGKTAEEKQQLAMAKEAARAASERAKQEAAYWASPVGRAALAKQRGDRFFQLELQTTELAGHSSDFWVSDVSKTRRTNGATDILGQIEELGWRLEHAGWVFIETGTSSRDKVLSSGERTTTSGRVEGVYLFRSVADQDALDPTVARTAASLEAGPTQKTDTTVFGVQ